MTGTVEDIAWAPGSSRSDLPIAVLISCKGYQGPTLWRMEPTEEMARLAPGNGFPYGWLGIHQLQGWSLSEVKLGFEKKGFATGLTSGSLIDSLDYRHGT